MGGIEPHLVLGESISQAAQFAASGAAQAGIVACSLIREPGIAARGHAVLLPATDHEPLTNSWYPERRGHNGTRIRGVRPDPRCAGNFRALRLRAPAEPTGFHLAPRTRLK